MFTRDVRDFHFELDANMFIRGIVSEPCVMPRIKKYLFLALRTLDVFQLKKRIRTCYDLQNEIKWEVYRIIKF